MNLGSEASSGGAVAASFIPQVTTAAVAANPAEPSINVSGLSLNSVLTLGNLVQQTVTPT